MTDTTKYRIDNLLKASQWATKAAMAIMDGCDHEIAISGMRDALERYEGWTKQENPPLVSTEGQGR